MLIYCPGARSSGELVASGKETYYQSQRRRPYQKELSGFTPSVCDISFCNMSDACCVKVNSTCHMANAVLGGVILMVLTTDHWISAIAAGATATGVVVALGIHIFSHLASKRQNDKKHAANFEFFESTVRYLALRVAQDKRQIEYVVAINGSLPKEWIFGRIDFIVSVVEKIPLSAIEIGDQTVVSLYRQLITSALWAQSTIRESTMHAGADGRPPSTVNVELATEALEELRSKLYDIWKVLPKHRPRYAAVPNPTSNPPDLLDPPLAKRERDDLGN